MFDLPIVDTHVHLWDLGHLTYPWLDNCPAINKTYLLDDYYAAYGPLNIAKMVFLQCDPLPEQNVDEVDWVTSLSQQDPRLCGIVSGGQLEQGDGVRPYLETLAQNPLMRGIRRLLHVEQDSYFCLQPHFIRGVQLLPEYNFSFDLCCTAAQLPNGVELVRQCPDVPVVLDHIGNPKIKDGDFDTWAANMSAIAELPNAWCKISGVVTGASENWTIEEIRPWVEHALTVFGFDRVMYGGDWPVVTLAAEYTQWVEALAEIVEGCSPDEKRKLFHDNAEKFYRL